MKRYQNNKIKIDKNQKSIIEEGKKKIDKSKFNVSIFRMKGFSGFGNSPMKKSTSREEKIKQNREFLNYAIRIGLAPKPPVAGDLSAKGRAELKAYEEFYGNKDNVKMLNKKQKEYFKNR